MISLLTDVRESISIGDLFFLVGRDMLSGWLRELLSDFPIIFNRKPFVCSFGDDEFGHQQSLFLLYYNTRVIYYIGEEQQILV